MNTKHIIGYPLSTEKAVKLMESENKLTFIVAKQSSKVEVKKEMEAMFKVKVTKVNTLITPQGRKKAYITLAPESPAIDVATQLGLL